MSSDIKAYHYDQSYDYSDSNNPKEILDSLILKVSKLYPNFPDSAFQISKSAMKIAEDLDDYDGQAQVYLRQLKIHEKFADANAMLECLEKVESIFPKLKDKKTLGIYYHEKAHFFRITGQNDKVRAQIDKAVAINLAINDRKNLSRNYNSLGLFLKAMPDSSIFYYEKNLEIAKEFRDTQRMIPALGNIANTYFRALGEYDIALAKFKELLDICQAVDSKNASALTSSNISKIYRTKKNFDKAIQYEMSALNIRQETSNIAGEIGSYLQLGNIYSVMERSEDALIFYKKATALSKTNNWTKHLPSLYNNIGTSYNTSKLNEPDSIKLYLNKAIEVSTELGNTENLVSAKINLGEFYMNNEDYQEAQKLFLEAFNHSQEGIVPYRIKQAAQLGLVDVYCRQLNEGLIVEGQIDKLDQMEANLKLMEPGLIESGDLKIKQLMFENFCRIYEWRKDYYNLSKYRGLMVEVSDSLYINSNTNAANEWAEKLKTKEKESEIAILESKNKLANFRNKMFLFAIIGLLIFFGCVSYLYRKYITQKNEKQKIVEAQNFRSKLSSDLHDEVGSVLSNLNIQSMLASKEKVTDKEELLSIAKLSQEALENLRDTVWAIDSRKDKYINLLDRMVEYGEKNLGLRDIDFELDTNDWTSDSKIDPEQRQNIFLIFKEAITNILKHSNATKVKVNAIQSLQLFALEISDNGTLSNSKMSDGLGLSNMKLRADNMDADISFDSSNGFAIKLNVPKI